MAAALPAATPARLLLEFPRAHGAFETRLACILVDLYVAQTPQQRAQGLMYIHELGEYEGMLFPTQEPAIVGMWMKNTYVSLDMFFIGADGRIRHIAERTEPLSERTIDSRVPVTGVVEMRGGFAARHGVARGDRFLLIPLAGD
jgi:uncharacterized membrane protein (UPF0127 family)